MTVRYLVQSALCIWQATVNSFIIYIKPGFFNIKAPVDVTVVVLKLPYALSIQVLYADLLEECP